MSRGVQDVSFGPAEGHGLERFLGSRIGGGSEWHHSPWSGEGNGFRSAPLWWITAQGLPRNVDISATNEPQKLHSGVVHDAAFISVGFD